jgi:hypothetical protein
MDHALDRSSATPDRWIALGSQPDKKKTRIVRGKPADRTFDIDFWQEQGDEAIFRAAWEMVVLAEETKHGRKPTLQRTVTHLE